MAASRPALGNRIPREDTAPDPVDRDSGITVIESETENPVGMSALELGKDISYCPLCLE